MSDAPEREAGGGTLRGSLARLADSLLGLTRTRLELAAVEYTEERTRVGRQLALTLAAVGCLLFALFFAAGAVVVAFWDTHRLPAIIGVSLFFALACGLLLWRRKEIANTTPMPFAASIAEFEKDRAALARTMHMPPAP